MFVIGILSTSAACGATTQITSAYKAALENEFAEISKRLERSGLTRNIRVVLVYIPLADKDGFVTAFDTKLKGLQ